MDEYKIWSVSCLISTTDTGDADGGPRFSRPPVSGQAATYPQLWTQEDAQAAEQGPRDADEYLKQQERIWGHWLS